LKGVGRKGTRTTKVAADHSLEIGKDWVVDGKLPFEIATHLAFHLVDLPQGEHTLSDDTPRLVGVGVVADHFRGDHKCRNK
jgi:hypothetical protein